MPACTYLSENQYLTPTSSKEINSLLAEIRLATGDDWRVREKKIIFRRWFRAPTIILAYDLFNHLHNGEFQIVNFLHDTEDTILAYFYGMLAGLEKECRQFIINGRRVLLPRKKSYERREIIEGAGMSGLSPRVLARQANNPNGAYWDEISEGTLFLAREPHPVICVTASTPVF